MAHKRRRALFKRVPAARSQRSQRQRKIRETSNSKENHGPCLQVWRPQVRLHHAVQVRVGRMPLRQVQEVGHGGNRLQNCGHLLRINIYGWPSDPKKLARHKDESICADLWIGICA
nr:uncharacterized protein LOC126539317 [Dermacentor andersoni]